MPGSAESLHKHFLATSKSSSIRSHRVATDTTTQKTNVALDGGAGHWKDCTYEVLMLDDRTLPSTVDPKSYWGLNAVINYAYAEKFGYKFHIVRPNLNGTHIDYDVEWMRPLYILDHFRERKENTGCTWLLYLDSDAFVREFDLPLDVYMRGLASTYNISEDVGGVVARERPISFVPDGLGTYLNPGVLFVQANAQGQFLLRKWIEAGRLPENNYWKTHFPREMGVLTNIWDNNPEIKSVLATVDMLEINSPWGRFVQHTWSGPSGDKMIMTEPSEMLLKIDARETYKFDRLMAQVVSHAVSWTPGPL